MADGPFPRAALRLNPIERFSSGSSWESTVGYSRAVRTGALVFIAGTTATGPDGELIAPDDAYGQTRQALTNVAVALGQAGASVRDVVQTRLYVRDIGCWEEVGRAHAEVFDEVRPVSTMVEVSRLIDSRMLVEVEALAVVDDSS